MRPEDVSLLSWSQDPNLSPDGSLVAWSEVSLDAERDAPVSAILVAPADGSGSPRRFTDGPGDFSPRWSPDGRYLAFLTAGEGAPSLRLAPLDGGEPLAVQTPGAVKWVEWSPQGDRLVLVLNVDRPEGEGKEDPRSRNAPRVMRGWRNRLDGAGWLAGRDHIFVYEVESAKLRRLTSGEYDHAQPSWSPDGESLVFVSNRSPDRDDDLSGSDLWAVATRGRPARRRVATGLAYATFPTFSPDGSRIAFAAVQEQDGYAGRDGKLFVVPADGSGEPRALAPALDRPTAFSLALRPFQWLSDDELIFTVAEAGAVHLRRAALADRGARPVLAGDRQVAGVSLADRGEKALVAFTSCWLDSPAEVYTLVLGRRPRQPVQVSRAGEELSAAVVLLPGKRLKAVAPDGMEIEYFAILPRQAGRRSGHKPPLFLEIHGGPHLYNPISERMTHYQGLAAAGYAVVLPNPRGSIGYGEKFSLLARGDWGDGPCADLMACVDDALRRGLADPKRQFVGGYSYGGYMSSWIVGHTRRFRAACIGAPATNHLSLFGTWDGGRYLADALAADPWSGHEHLRAQSPVTYAGEVETPVLLYVNEGDMRCPPSQADEFFAALKWHGKEVEYVRYPGGSHLSAFPMLGPPSQSEDRERRILDWLARHGGLKAAARP